MRALALAIRGAPGLAGILAAGRAWADHGAAPRGSMNPWLEVLLWGVLGLAVAMTVALIVTIFTRAAAGGRKGERHPR
jgi:hypothetical protein